MCGNFGLVIIGYVNEVKETIQPSVHSDVDGILQSNRVTDALDRSLNESLHRVSKLKGIQTQKDSILKDEVIVSPIEILEAQAACTEIRGGQAGGYSSMEFSSRESQHQSRFEALFGSTTVTVADNTRYYNKNIHC